jgi:Fe2+ or Zn2+ uptake regulation protein
MRSPDELTSLFRASGLKMTPQRRAVFAALHGDEGHPTADVIWSRVCEQMPMVSQKTIYQALNDLVELGEVKAVTVGSGAIRFDPNTSDHAHFVCRNCERISDVTASLPELLASPQGSVADHLVETSEIIFRGQCPSCR